ncbi:MAG: hypothetical protein ABEJ03_01420 [Candidatus Nanohaloarchaea archaeon]
MVYEKKCVECDKIIDFGGSDDGNLPDDAMRFNGDLYCRECVKDFVEFGTGDILDRIDQLEDDMKDVMRNLGLEKGV